MWSIDDFKLGTGPSNVQIQENVQPTYYICKEKFDKYVAKTQMEEYRLKKMKGGISSQESQDQIVFDVLYTPNFIIEGTHEIKHLRKSLIHQQFAEDVIAVNIGDAILKLEDLEQLRDGTHQITMLELVSHKNSNKIILDDYGKPMKEKDIPEYQPLEAGRREEILEKEQISIKINEKLLIDNFKTSLLKPSQDNIKTLEENLDIEIKIILRGTYIGTITVQGKTKKIAIDSVTGESKVK